MSNSVPLPVRMLMSKVPLHITWYTIMQLIHSKSVHVQISLHLPAIGIGRTIVSALTSAIDSKATSTTSVCKQGVKKWGLCVMHLCPSA